MSRYAPISFALAFASVALAGGESHVYLDAVGDATIRRTDLGLDDAISPTAALPDLIRVDVYGWAPTDAFVDRYAGSVNLHGAEFVRIDVQLRGVFAPPGTLGLGPTSFDPFAFGDSPVYGFIELDVDNDDDTGGELGAAAEQRYFANVARFGALPKGSEGALAARSGATGDHDMDFWSPPYFERSGADFAIVLCGCSDVTVVSEGGDADGAFEVGETWVVSSRFFQRAGGYQGASGVFGGSDFGLYDPLVELRFSHDVVTDRTTITLVYPLTMEGAAALRNEPVQASDQIIGGGSHDSVEEAVIDLRLGAQGFNVGPLSGPVKVLTEEWEDNDVSDALKPSDWRVRAIVGTTYMYQSDGLYVWTDVGFDEEVGDLDSSGYVNESDVAAFDAGVLTLDGTSDDADGLVNGTVELHLPGPNFSVFDRDGDGIIESADAPPVLCEGDVSTTGASVGSPGLGQPDGTTDLSDLLFFVNVWQTDLGTPTANPGSRSDVTATGSTLGEPAHGVPDGVVDLSDLLFYVNDWLIGRSGCP